MCVVCVSTFPAPAVTLNDHICMVIVWYKLRHLQLSVKLKSAVFWKWKEVWKHIFLKERQQSKQKNVWQKLVRLMQDL